MTIKFNPKCFAYDDNGNICGKSAVYVDNNRGCMVCEEHKPVDMTPDKLREMKV